VQRLPLDQPEEDQRREAARDRKIDINIGVAGERNRNLTRGKNQQLASKQARDYASVKRKIEETMGRVL
jgi:hypothetical protein